MTLFDEEFVGIKEIMEFFDVTRRTVNLWMKNNHKFPKPFRIGRKVKWKKSEMEAYVNSTRDIQKHDS